MIRFLIKSSMLIVLLLSGCATDPNTNKGLKVVVGNQWPLIKVVLPAKRTQTVQPVLATPVPVNIPRQVIARPTVNLVKPAPKRVINRSHKRTVPTRSKQRIVHPKPAVKKEQCRYIVRDLSVPGSNVIYCMPSKAY